MKPGASDDLHTPVAPARPWWTTRPGWRAPRARRSLVLGGLVLAAVLSTRWVRLNGSPSVPRGVYLLHKVSLALVPGTLVVLPVPASVQQWHSRFLPLLKPIAAVEGAVICVEEAGLWVAGVFYGPVVSEAAGQALPRLQGCHTVPAGQVFLASQAPWSLDSRYFGPVPVVDLTAIAIPLLTWR